MNQVSTADKKTSKKFHPTNLLEQISKSQVNGCLHIYNGEISYYIHFNRGKIIYATNSIDPLERLSRYLLLISHKVPKISSELRKKVRLFFEDNAQKESVLSIDYKAICWLVEKQYINQQIAAYLAKKITQEVFESYLLFSEVFYTNFFKFTSVIPAYCYLNLDSFIGECQQKIQAWQALSPQICSPHQRPYFLYNAYAQRRLSPDQKEKLGSLLLKGLSFRQLGALTNQDELSLAQRLYPLIVNGSIILRDPQVPFDKLPRIVNYALEVIPKNTPIASADEVLKKTDDPDRKSVSVLEKPKIVCIDDSPTVLNEISRCLENHKYELFTINEPLTALRKIIRIKPDLILLDITMPNINGYRLCHLIRNHSFFQETPIVMVTGSKGLINRAKAKLAGASGYITKPFTQSQLLKIVTKYLN